MRDHFDDAALQVAKARFWRGAAIVELRRGGAAAFVEARSAADALRTTPNVEQSVMEEVDAWLATRDLSGARVPGRAGAN